MNCPVCGTPDTRVINSRPSAEGSSIRRRRECANEACKHRFTTFEHVERVALRVVKRDGTRELYDPAKLRAGLEKALEKRPASTAEIERIVSEIENEAQANAEAEVTTEALGLMVLQRLRALDKVAYLRFVSVYRQFQDLQDFDAEIQGLLKD